MECAFSLVAAFQVNFYEVEIAVLFFLFCHLLNFS